MLELPPPNELPLERGLLPNEREGIDWRDDDELGLNRVVGAEVLPPNDCLLVEVLGLV